MSITDELREWTRTNTVNCSDNRIALVGIAERIDAEHKRMYADLTVGDLVVHVNHGIGKYLGIQTLTTDGVTKDCITLQYTDGKIYVPCNQLDLVSKYIGGDDNTRLSKLGGAEWKKAKLRAKAAASDIYRIFSASHGDHAVVGVEFSVGTLEGLGNSHYRVYYVESREKIHIYLACVADQTENGLISTL